MFRLHKGTLLWYSAGEGKTVLPILYWEETEIWSQSRKPSNPGPPIINRPINCPLRNDLAGGWRAGYRSLRDPWERAGHNEEIFLTKPEIHPRGGRTRDLEVLLGSLNHYARGPFARQEGYYGMVFQKQFSPKQHKSSNTGRTKYFSIVYTIHILLCHERYGYSIRTLLLPLTWLHASILDMARCDLPA